MAIVVWLLAASFTVAVLIKWMMTADPPPINDVYSQPSKWYTLKYLVFKALLWLRKRKQNQQVTGDNAGLGTKSRNSPEEMDKAQVLPKDQPKAVDAVYLTGSNSAGQFLVAATARRHNNHVQTILFLRTKELGMLELPSMPDTSLLGDREGEFSAGGLTIQVVEPMTTWKISYTGKLRVVSTGKLVDVKLDLTWEACSMFFDFDTDLHPNVLADAIAREKWSRDFFKTLQSVHQTHYEQFGRTMGRAEIQGHTPVTIDVRGVRDHSYGNLRDWKLFHRYCIQYVAFEDGSNLCVAAVSLPITTSRLHCGYMSDKDGNVEPVSWCDLEFYNLGDDGKPCTEFTVKFDVGGSCHSMDVKVLDSRTFYIGDGRDAKIHERYCRFNMDGVVGYGLSEWDYKNTDGTSPENKDVAGMKYFTAF